MNLSRIARALVLASALSASLASSVAAFAAESRPVGFSAPNVVPITPRLTTSGQPTRDTLVGLSELGYEAVIYLAPPSVGDAIREEGALVGEQGLAFVNIPIRFNDPTEKDFELFAAAVTALRDRKLLVHCQVNMRASSMTFLYRVLVNKEDPEKAYQDVVRVWTPNGTWKNFIVAMLKKHNVPFEPY